MITASKERDAPGADGALAGAISVAPGAAL
jgi:hypothetical protein